MNEQKIEEIKDALRELAKLLIERNQLISKEMKLKLAQVFEFAANRIAQLRQEGGVSLTQEQSIIATPESEVNHEKPPYSKQSNS